MLRRLLHALALGAVLAGLAGAIELCITWIRYPHHLDPGIWTAILPSYLFAGSILGWCSFVVSPALTRKTDRSHHPGLQLAILILIGGACVVLSLNTSGEPSVRLGIAAVCAILAHQALRLIFRTALGWSIATLFSPLTAFVGLIILLFSSLLAWQLPTIPSPHAGHQGAYDSSNSASPTNLIVLNLSGIQQDFLSCYGYFRNTSPCIDQLAQEGVLFLNETRTPISKDSKPATTLISNTAKLLRESGWETSGISIGDSPLNLEESLHGFAQFTDLSQISLRRRLFIPQLQTKLLSWKNPDRNRPQNAMDHAISWLKAQSNKGKPFFLSIQLGSAAPPHKPTASTQDHFLPEGILAEEAFGNPPNPVAVRALRDAEVLEIDYAICFLVESLSKLDFLENTILVLCASPLNPKARAMPLILRCPSEFTAGSRISEATSLEGVLTSLAGWLGGQSEVGNNALSSIRRS